ncbi:TreTu family toxin [Streptomyces xanthophaeus]
MADSTTKPSLGKLKQPKPVRVTPVKAGGAKKQDAAAQSPWKTPLVSWPAAGSAEVDLTSGTASKSFVPPASLSPSLNSAAAQAGTLPVRVSAVPAKAAEAPSKVHVSVAAKDAARKAGVDGLLLSVARSDGSAKPSTANVEVDYSTFRNAYGGDYAARLHLVELPACALTTPDRPECRTQTALQTKNDPRTGKLSAQIATPATAASSGPAAKSPSLAQGAASMAVAPRGATVLAATAGASGSTGDYKATPLQPSGSWTAGGATGAFSWSYNVEVPTVPGGLTPSLGLHYSSQSVDGRMAASNSQASWIGDGWSWEPGYVERKYKPCNDDKTGGTNTTKVGDHCWFNDNATLSLNGKNTELVFEQGKGWHPANDSGEKVEKLTGAVNGDKGTAGVDGTGEHWKITTTDGTQYFFGLNRLPGWKDNGAAADDPVTNSTWTMPVFGNQTGEPCYNASFASAWCQQAWRWQLDYVVAPSGNAMAYYWKTEGNNYTLNVSATTGKGTVAPYIRGGWLDHIDYGLRSDAVYTGKAMGQVAFGVSERCLTGCTTFDETNAKNWPDSPYDLYCKDGSTECKDQTAPTFWSRMRLTDITTKVLTGGTYQDVDSWKLDHDFPASGDGLSRALWLKSITRTGKSGDGPDVTLPPVTFTGEQKANRVDKTGDGLAPYIRLRLSQVNTETGGTIGVTYSGPDCTTATLPQPDETNTTRCFPTKWAWEGDETKLDWFNTYTVTQVTEGDNIVDTPDKVTSYAYLGGAAWAKSTDELAKDTDRVHSVARGYGLVQTRTGVDNTPKTLTETRYFRGLDGKDVKDSTGTAVTDRDQFAGSPRETVTYNGDDTTKPLTATSTTPWRSAAAATRKRTGLPDLVAVKIGTEKLTTRLAATGGIRTIESISHFDEYGMADSVSDAGDIANTGDETCTRTSYARNTQSWILNKVSRIESVSVPCATTPARPTDIVSDVRTYYDNAPLGQVPGTGLMTKTEKINGKGDGYDAQSSVPSTCGPAKNQLCYDAYGRQLTAADAYGKTTTTAYTPAAGEAPTSMTVTNPLGHIVASGVDPLRSQPTKVTDANGKVTTTAYDALGRTTKIWLPNWTAAEQPDKPSRRFEYTIRNDGPNVTTTKALTHDYQYAVTYQISDGLLRERQTQTQSPDLSGRLITETYYDTRGQAWRSSGTFYADGPPTAQLVTGQETGYPASTDTLFDGAGRPTDIISKRFGVETKRTVKQYTGDSITLIPPAGGTATTSVVDALGRTVELKQYTDAARTTSQSTLYAYDKQGHLGQVTDPSGTKWAYTYDTRGLPVETSDPDKGVTKTAYDQGGRRTDSTDARGFTLHTDYDELGRPTALKQGTTTLTTQTYDTVAKGQPAKATRFVDGKAYESEVLTYNHLYQPLDTQVTIPSTPDTGALAGVYKWTDSYNITGQLLTTKQPAIGGLPAETVGSTYKPVSGLLNNMAAGSSRLVSAMTYDHYGRSIRQELGAPSQRLYRTTDYDDHTGAITRSTTSRDVAPQQIEATSYGYNPAGNVTSLATAYGQDATRTTDTQCVNLDALTRITQAWTNKGETCAPAPDESVIGGEDPYWTSYTYDAVGNRKTETKHKTASGPTADTVRTYSPPTPGKHDLTKVTQTGTAPHEETFAYDATGNTKTRKLSASDETQYLSWDAEGHLKSADQGTSSNSFLYDTAGQRLLRKDSQSTTLYLPAGNELTLDKTGKVTGTRYYGGVAMRTGGKLTFTLADHHGTGTMQVTADTTQTVTRRKTGIFGDERGTQPTAWTGDKGFVGGTKDTETGLTHLGAREYDPSTGRFISVDPIMDLTNSQQLHGYVYSSNNPVSLSDPTGLIETDCWNGNCGGHYNPRDDKKSVTDTSRPKPMSGGYDYTPPKYQGSVTYHYPTILEDDYGVAFKLPKEKKQEFIKIYIQKYTEQTQWHGMGFSEKDNWINKTQAMIYACEAIKCEGKDLEYYVKQHGAAVEAVYGLGYGEGGSAAGMMAVGAKGNARTGTSRTTGCQCFLAGTQVLLADGTTKNIEEMAVGDEVLTTDPRSDQTEKHAVTRVIIARDDKQFNQLQIATPDGISGLTATHEHPFWSPSQGAWVVAADLRAGMSLRTSDGDVVIVVGNTPYTSHATTYNLTVDDHHTYYVLAGQTPVLVHNSGGHTPDDGMATVGRWMSGAEHRAMMETGMVQRGGGGFTYVVYPANRDAYISARPGSVYAEFDVPKSSLIPGGRPGDFKMSDSDTIFARLAQKKGNPVPQLPEAKNIKLGGWGCS